MTDRPYVTTSTGRSARATWPAQVIGGLILLLGLVMALGGGWLLALGGSWYYLPAGVGLVLAGVLLMRGRTAGAGWFGAVFIATLLWTLWESGLGYWGWVPRVGLLLVLAFFVSLLLPRLDRRSSRALAGTCAAVCLIGFVVAAALAFVPHGVTKSTLDTSNPVAAIAAAASAGASALPAAEDPAPGDWAAYGRDNAATRYSPLAQIDVANVAGLQRAWVYRTGDIPEHGWGAETTPLKVGDSLYLCSARNVLIALDATSGQERWRHEPDPPVDYKSIPYTAACRGVAYYAVPETPTAAGAPPPAAGACAQRIIEGTLDGRLIAVDALTGKPCRDFGDNGQVRITDGMGETPAGYVAINSAPTIVRGVVVTGHQVLDGQERYAPSGVILGYDARSGALRWAWDMVRPQLNGEPPPGEVYTRGTPNMWTTASGDEALGLVYLPMGNASADYLSSQRRPAENEYSSALVAIDVTTGKPAWHFQTVHKDVWDYDLGSQATLIDYPGASGTVPALLLPSKQGDIYVLDRRTGEALTPVAQLAAPAGGVEPQQRATTQPTSAWHTLRQPPLREADMWGLSPIDQLVCRIQFRQARYDGIYTPPTAAQPFIQYPGYNGGSDWGGVAVDVRRGWIVANYNDMPNYDRMVPRETARQRGWVQRAQAPNGKVPDGIAPQQGTPYAVDINAGWRLPVTGLLCKQPPYGGIRAIDIATGKTIWDRPFGTARRNGPFGIPSHLPLTIGTPNNGGGAVTAGGLVFIAAATDNLIRAIDIRTGETVWQDTLPAGGQATPMVYAAGGREYLVIVAAGHHFMMTPPGDYVIAYALPQSGSPRPPP